MKFISGKPTAGLVIRGEEVELLSMRGRRIESRVRVPIAGTEESHLLQAIQQVMASVNLKDKKLAVAIPMQDVLIRFFTLPLIPKPEWEMAVQFEARKYIPFKTDSLVWDFHVINATAASHPTNAKTSQEPRLEVVFAGVPQETFHRFQRALSSAGIQPTTVEPVSLSLARLAAAAQDKAPNQFMCLLDVEQERAHLVIARGGIPYLTRDISLSWKEQDPALLEHADAADRRIQRLLSELRVSMDFFVREYPSAAVNQIVLFGEPEAIGSMEQWQAAQFQSTIELGTTLVNQYVDGELSLSYASVLGLLQGGQKKTETLNFLKRNTATQGSPAAPRKGMKLDVEWLASWLKTPQVTLFATLAVGTLMCWWMLGARQVSLAKHQLNQLISSRSDVGWGLSGRNEKELKSMREKAQQQLEVVKLLVGQQPSLAAKLDALARSLPDGVWLTGLKFDNQLDPSGKSNVHLLVDGACFLGASGQELSAIQELEERVKKNPTLTAGFSATQLEQISAEVDHEREVAYRTFQLNCQSQSSNRRL